MTKELVDEISRALNRHSAENGSNTPDFLLAEFLVRCLRAFDKTSWAREKWYGKHLCIGAEKPDTRVSIGEDDKVKLVLREPAEQTVAPVAPPVIQAEPDVERARMLFGKLKLGCSHDDVEIVKADYAAISREAERTAFEKAANEAARIITCPQHGHDRHHDCVSCHRIGDVYRAIRSLADSPVSGNEKKA